MSTKRPIAARWERETETALRTDRMTPPAQSIVGQPVPRGVRVTVVPALDAPSPTAAFVGDGAGFVREWCELRRHGSHAAIVARQEAGA